MKKFNDVVFFFLTHLAAISVIIFLAGIIYSIFSKGLPIFADYGIIKFIFGRGWYPTHAEHPEFGIFSLMIGSLAATFLALIIAIPLGLGSAIYISEMAGFRIKEILKPVIELLSAIPSVIYGLFGMAYLAPTIQKIFDLPTGYNLFSASIILGLMVVPIISSMAEDALSAVPVSLREASLALGANKIETIAKIVIPSAKTGIAASIILGFGRAVGETMVVLMVSGGAAKLPDSIFSPVRPLTSTIAAEMGETPIGSQHYQALFGIAIVLFMITFCTNLVMEYLVSRKKSI